MSEQQHARAVIYGLALGDALGWPIKFLRMEKIQAIYGDDGISEPPDHAEYSDETQTSLVVAETLIDAGSSALNDVMESLSRRLVTWSNSPENTRAPGHTITESIRNLEAGVAWQDAGAEALGNGSTIRVAPVGYFFQHQPDMLRNTAAAIGRATHTHQTAQTSTIAAAYLVKLGLDHAPIEQYVNLTLQFVRGKSDDFEELFAQIPDRLTWSDPKAALATFGGGWRAHEAVTMAAFCLLSYPDDFQQAVKLAANIAGDSDAVASLTGGMAGALVGMGGLPDGWVERLENRQMLEDVADRLEAKKERVFGAR